MMTQIREAVHRSVMDIARYWQYLPVLYIGQAVFVYMVLQHVHKPYMLGLGLSLGGIILFTLLVGDPRLTRGIKQNAYTILKVIIYTAVFTSINYGFSYLTQVRNTGRMVTMTSVPTVKHVLFTTVLFEPVYWLFWIVMLAMFMGFIMIAVGMRLRTAFIASPLFFLQHPVKTGVAFVVSLGIAYLGLTVFAIPAFLVQLGVGTVQHTVFAWNVVFILSGTTLGSFISLRFLTHYYDEVTL